MRGVDWDDLRFFLAASERGVFFMMLPQRQGLSARG